MSLSLILSLRGLLPFSGVIFTVLVSKSRSIHSVCHASPNLAPYVHAKLIIVDYKSYILGSSNQTDSGIYYNYEAIDICNDISKVDKIADFFEGLWNLHENYSFEQVKQFLGYRTKEGFSTRQQIAERIVGFFLRNGNQSVLKWKLCKEIQSMGYYENDVISTIKGLIADGVLYEPNMNSYRKVSD
jgi:phosphatidylserine/phosphatidylglycerophosphate/cardiolipin synthase-like enzyme